MNIQLIQKDFKAKNSTQMTSNLICYGVYHFQLKSYDLNLYFLAFLLTFQSSWSYKSSKFRDTRQSLRDAM